MSEDKNDSNPRCIFGEMHTDEGVHPMEVTLSRSPSSDFGDSDSSSDETEPDSNSDSDSSDGGNDGGVEDNDCDCDECSSNKRAGERKSANNDRMNMYALNWRATKAPSEVINLIFHSHRIFCRSLGPTP